MRRLATIGVYGFTAQSFLDRLREANVRQLLDVRQRRGVRGHEYMWANARRIQLALTEAGIEYRHHRDLAPTTGLRQLLYSEDARLGIGQRSRTVLAPAFAERYTREILDSFDLRPIVEDLPTDGAGALFCVERDPEACHRSLIAERLTAEYGLPVTHLEP